MDRKGRIALLNKRVRGGRLYDSLRSRAAYGGLRGDIPLEGIALVHPEGIDGPVRVGERFRVVADVVLAGTGEGGAGGVLAPDGAGPVAAEGGVEDDVVVLEMLVDVTAALAVVGSAADEAGAGMPPCARVRVRARDVAGFAAAREKPDVDPAAGPLHGVDAAVGVIEPCTEAVGVRGLDVAAQGALAGAAGEAAPVAGVHGHAVAARGIDALDDVDFAAVGPVRARHPEGGPGAADAAGHVCEIEDYEAVGVLGFASEAYAGAASAGGYVCVIDAEGHLAIADVEHVHGVGGCLVDVIDVPMGWVIELISALVMTSRF